MQSVEITAASLQHPINSSKFSSKYQALESISSEIESEKERMCITYMETRRDVAAQNGDIDEGNEEEGNHQRPSRAFGHLPLSAHCFFNLIYSHENYSFFFSSSSLVGEQS